MKVKLIVITLLLSLLAVSCKKKKAENNIPAKLNVENVTNSNRQEMFTKFGKDYKWFECCVVLKDYLDSECDGTVEGISNVFQVVEEDETGADVHVFLYTTTPDTTSIDEKHGFWVEDMPLNDEQIKITFAQAFEKINEVNYVKPHSRHAVLRKEVGPIDANPQWIFGNSHSQLYVDAVTGKVTDKNPVFPADFKMPQW